MTSVVFKEVINEVMEMFKKENRMTTVFLIVMVGLIILAVTASFLNKKDALPPLQTETTMEFNINDQPVLGNPSAPVSMTVFYDYNCPHCATWDKEVLPLLEGVILADDNVNMRFVNYSFMKQSSTYAAVAAEIVHESAPDKFLDFHKDVLANQLAITVDTLAELVTKHVPELTIEKVKEDLINQTHIDHVLSDRDYGIELGVNSTPSLFVGDERIENVGDLKEIQDKINAQKAITAKEESQ